MLKNHWNEIILLDDSWSEDRQFNGKHCEVIAMTFPGKMVSVLVRNLFFLHNCAPEALPRVLYEEYAKRYGQWIILGKIQQKISYKRVANFQNWRQFNASELSDSQKFRNVSPKVFKKKFVASQNFHFGRNFLKNNVRIRTLRREKRNMFNLRWKFISNYMKVNLSKIFLNFCDWTSNFL